MKTTYSPAPAYAPRKGVIKVQPHCGFRIIDGNSHQLGTSDSQLLYLNGSRNYIRRIGVGHRLHDHRRSAANRNSPFSVTDCRMPAVAPCKRTGNDWKFH